LSGKESRLIIAYDTFFLNKGFRNVGIYEYAKNLLYEFHALAAENNGNLATIRYFVSPGYSDDEVFQKPSVPGCEPVNTRLLAHSRLWRAGLVATAACRAGADLIFTPSPNILPVGSIPIAVTIHDAMPRKLPSQVVERGRRLRAGAWFAAKWSDKVITDSEYSKKDLVESYNLAPEKVSVVYLGYDRKIFNSSPVDSRSHEMLLSKLGVRPPYIIHHGMVQSRKNLSRLIQAYKLLLNRRPDIGLQLVLAGPMGFGSEQIIRTAQELTLRRSVLFTGALNTLELASLIKGASLCIIPSLYEGFCLPMLEAMACGVPTLAANSTCLPEVSGGALKYFDPMSEEDIVKAMENGIDDSQLRRDLAIRGLKRASEFSWRRCAEETLSVLTTSEYVSFGAQTKAPESKSSNAALLAR
jgi:glycosyltransferase involved in cell wall biosynthesis